MDADRLFLRRCSELVTLHESQDEIHLIDMGGKLRQLLFDQHSLVDLVNNNLRLEFRAGTFPPHMTPEGDPFWEHVEYQALHDGLDPETSHSGRFVCLTRNQFSQHLIAYSRGQKITVRDVVKYNANGKGGVHFDPHNPKFRVLAMTESLRIGGHSAGSAHLRAITRVTLKGLTPLIQLVKSRA